MSLGFDMIEILPNARTVDFGRLHQSGTRSEPMQRGANLLRFLSVERILWQKSVSEGRMDCNPLVSLPTGFKAAQEARMSEISEIPR
jgi:hypothetical protein